MKKFRTLVAAVVAGTLVFTSVPAKLAYAEPSDDILVETSDDEKDIITPVSDTDLIDDSHISPETQDSTGDAPKADDEEYKGYFGYDDPEWVGEPIAVDEDLSIKEIDDMVEGEEIIITEEGEEIRESKSLRVDDFGGSADSVWKNTDEIPAAFPSAYGDGSEAALIDIDVALADRLTGTKDQSPYGSCWAHQVMALTEAYKINQQNGTPDSIDNSERHLVYNMYASGSTYPGLGLDSYDTVNLGDGVGEEVFLDQGGNAVNAAVTLMKWRGVATEEEFPYPSAELDSWDNSEFVSTAGRLENCYLVDIFKNPDVVKRFIQEYGAVGISYYTPSGMSPTTDSRYYKAETNAYYFCDGGKDSNHSVAVVGWDDNFPRSAFSQDPGSDGAWLVRNSWTTNGSVGDKSYRSYFWMSYADKGLQKNAFVYKMQDSDEMSERNYYYDSTIHESGYRYYGEGYKLEAANVFPVSGSEGFEKLDSVTIQNFCEIEGNDNSYRIEIYSSLKDENIPDSGKLIAVKEGELPFLGLYTIYFDKPVPLTKGSFFSVVVSINGGAKTVDYERELVKNPKIDDITYNETYSVGSGLGQSFYRKKYTDEWYDMKSKGLGNFCIGAQTSDFEGETCSVTVYSRTDKNAESVANVSIASPAVFPNTEVTVTASDMTSFGYSFCGWYAAETISDDGKVTEYDGNDRLCDKLQYTFTVTGNTNLVAIYKTNDTVSITINVKNGAKYKVTDQMYIYGGAEQDGTYTRSFMQGKTLKLIASDPNKVLQWENENGKVLGRGAILDISVNRNMTITLVYKVEGEDQAYLEFVSDYGQVLRGEYVSTGSDISILAGPTKCGYTFVKWIFKDTGDDVDEAAIKGKIPEMAASGGKITVVPMYSKDETTYNITVKYWDNYNDVPISYQTQNQNTIVQSVGTSLDIIAPTIDGYKFECWNDETGKHLGYKPSYYLLVNTDRELTACYVPEAQNVPEEQPVIVLSDLYKTTDGNGIHKVSGVATRSIPDGYELEGQGMLWSKGIAGLDESNFHITSAYANQYVGTKTSLNGYLYLNVKVPDDDTIVTLRGYMILREKSTGSIITKYTDIKSATYGSL